MKINTTSITEEHGQKIKSFAKKLLKNGYADFVATDVHSIEKRGPYIQQALTLVESWVPQI